MIKYFVRTTGERQLDSSFSQIKYTLWIDNEHKPMQAFVSLLEAINDYDAVILEDDIILCENFKEEIERVINKYPNQIINFFNAPTLYKEVEVNSNFCYMQCRYYPKGTAKPIADKLKPYFRDKKVCPRLNAVLGKQGFTLLQYRPCLVQHLDDSSLVGNRYGNRRSPYFIDYLEELNMTYEETQKEENKEKLIALMEKKLK